MHHCKCAPPHPSCVPCVCSIFVLVNKVLVLFLFIGKKNNRNQIRITSPRKHTRKKKHVFPVRRRSSTPLLKICILCNSAVVRFLLRNESNGRVPQQHHHLLAINSRQQRPNSPEPKPGTIEFDFFFLFAYITSSQRATPDRIVLCALSPMYYVASFLSFFSNVCCGQNAELSFWGECVCVCV